MRGIGPRSVWRRTAAVDFADWDHTKRADPGAVIGVVRSLQERR